VFSSSLQLQLLIEARGVINPGNTMVAAFSSYSRVQRVQERVHPFVRCEYIVWNVFIVVLKRGSNSGKGNDCSMMTSSL
jgi:hypothetical protein